MAGTTTNFGISYPTDTDYVYLGAQAIQTVAQGFDTRLGNQATFPNQIVNVVSGVSRPLPYAISAGRQNISGSSIATGAAATATFTFASSTRFTAAPILVVTQCSLPSGAGLLIPKATGVGTTGFTAYFYNAGSTAATWTNAEFDYVAIQMTSASAPNS